MFRRPKPYTYFAEVYDSTMGEVPYKKWAYFVETLFKKKGISYKDYILDIGAGTGKMEEFLKKKYPYIVGVDISYPMLRKARGKIPYRIVARMESLPFSSESFSAAFCVHDSVNYILDQKGLLEHFKEVFRVLRPHSLYIFDISTEKNVMENFHNRIFHEKHGAVEFIWENFYDREKKIITSYLLFRKGKELVKEKHVQRIYMEEEVEEVFRKVGFVLEGKYRDYGFQGVPSDRARLLVYVLLKP